MGKSSKDKRDSYYRLAKEQGYRARSAYKLLQLNEQFNLFKDVTRVVDLCAAPGSWSQVLSRCLVPSAEEPTRKKVHVVALDLQPMTPLAGVITLQADITHPSTLPLLLRNLQSDSSNVDLVISDGAPDVTGLHDLDEYIQAQLLLAALNLAACCLRPGGTFVAKIFRGRDVDELYCQLRALFEKVTVAKPRSSRGSSIEAFVVCEGYAPPAGFEPSLENPIAMGTSTVDDKITGKMGEVMLEDEIPEEDDDDDDDDDDDEDESVVKDDYKEEERKVETSRGRWIAPFLACGDLSAFDSDATYPAQVDEHGNKKASIDPVQPPTAPPYKRALEMRRQGSKAPKVVAK